MCDVKAIHQELKQYSVLMSSGLVVPIRGQSRRSGPSDVCKNVLRTLSFLLVAHRQLWKRENRVQ